jgi:hypothetical protein
MDYTLTRRSNGENDLPPPKQEIVTDPWSRKSTKRVYGETEHACMTW